MSSTERKDFTSNDDIIVSLAGNILRRALWIRRERPHRELTLRVMKQQKLPQASERVIWNPCLMNQIASIWSTLPLVFKLRWLRAVV